MSELQEDIAEQLVVAAETLDGLSRLELQTLLRTAALVITDLRRQVEERTEAEREA
ncbi:hypothetical protein SAMN05216548_10899 [Faunimonas pinastri]|uniref:Uncharacterized protein n=1 Tax=Faunimonas pinastri TaxID=1855383 RepID=A0A1H9JF71_9HYPH|nr:hypothetical protein [Faunimonas pinastri]SEQ85419.1 hypothetical protein SAMN05216548_10899 [Faunimonas pinastri]